MTTDYSKLDTAALVQAADALMAEIAPGAWEWDSDDFSAAAPALISALVTRLRETVPAYKFNVGDRVRVLFWGIGATQDWQDGEVLTVTNRTFDANENECWYVVTDGIIRRRVAECNLESVSNG